MSKASATQLCTLVPLSWPTTGTRRSSTPTSSPHLSTPTCLLPSRRTAYSPLSISTPPNGLILPLLHLHVRGIRLPIIPPSPPTTGAMPSPHHCGCPPHSLLIRPLII